VEMDRYKTARLCGLPLWTLNIDFLDLLFFFRLFLHIRLSSSHICFIVSYELILCFCTFCSSKAALCIL